PAVVNSHLALLDLLYGAEAPELDREAIFLLEEGGHFRILQECNFAADDPRDRDRFGGIRDAGVARAGVGPEFDGRDDDRDGQENSQACVLSWFHRRSPSCCNAAMP